MPATPTNQARRNPSRCWSAALTVALAASIAVATPSAASAGSIAESFRQWSQRRQTRSRVEKPFTHRSDMDLSVHPSAWSKLRSSGMVSALRGAAGTRMAGQGNHPSVVGKLRDRLTSRGEGDKSGFQQSTEPIHHAQGLISR